MPTLSRAEAPQPTTQGVCQSPRLKELVQVRPVQALSPSTRFRWSHASGAPEQPKDQAQQFEEIVTLTRGCARSIKLTENSPAGLTKKPLTRMAIQQVKEKQG
jgi:hypothetical protein